VEYISHYFINFNCLVQYIYFGGILLKLIVLGNYGPYPKAGGACSGFLLESGSHKILIDCGSGVISRLQHYIDIEELSAVFLSHLHSDHASDILILGYAADIKLKKGDLDKPIKVYAPGEPIEEYMRISERTAFEVNKIDENLVVRIEDIKITFKQMMHSYDNYAICIEKDNKKFVYSGDTMPNNELIEFAKNADLFLCEAGLLERDEKSIRAMHLTAKEAGEISEKAKVKRLLLTHFLPYIKMEQYINEASTVYNGMMEIAGENKSYFI